MHNLGKKLRPIILYIWEIKKRETSSLLPDIYVWFDKIKYPPSHTPFNCFFIQWMFLFLFNYFFVLFIKFLLFLFLIFLFIYLRIFFFLHVFNFHVFILLLHVHVYIFSTFLIYRAHSSPSVKTLENGLLNAS